MNIVGVINSSIERLKIIDRASNEYVSIFKNLEEIGLESQEIYALTQFDLE